MESLSMKAILPFVAMVMVEFGEVGMITVAKAAMNSGMSNLVFVVYYNALGTFILLPFFILHSYRSQLPPLNFSLLCRFSLLGLLGICMLQVFAYVGIRYSSPTLATALGNLIPIFTFILAIIFRMERLDIRRSSSQAKCLGTVVAISGAFLITLYKGPPILMPKQQHSNSLLSQQSNWVIGAIFLVITCIFSSSWNIFQTATVKRYPDEISIVFFYCLFGTIECAILSLIMERTPSAWMLRSGIEMVAIAFSGLFGSVFRSSVLTWCLRKKGPVFVAMFKPMGMVIAVIMGVLFLSDTLFLGSFVGAFLIGVGFYSVMWGQAKEKKCIIVNADDDHDIISRLESSAHNTPLLGQNVTHHT